MAEHNQGAGAERKRAGLFDIRVIIAALIGAYGVILVVTSLFTSDAAVEKSAGLNINLYAGLGMLVAAGAFFAWARWRPIVVPEEPEAAPEEPAAH